MSEQRHRVHVGSHIVSGEADGIHHLQTLSSDSARGIFEQASEGGEAHFTANEAAFTLKRNPDYTFTVTTNHRTHLAGG